MSRPALPRASSATSGFFFCGSIELPGGLGVVEADEAELLGRPQHDLLADAATGARRAGRGRTAPRRRSRGRRRRRGSSRSGRRSRARRRRRRGRAAATSRPARRHPSGDTSSRRTVSQQPVDVARAAPRRGPAGGGPAAPAGPAAGGCSRAGRRRRRRRPAAASTSLQVEDALGHPSELAAGVEPQVGGHLVVAAAAGVELGPDVAGELGDPPLDGGVDVLVARGEDEDAPRRAPPRPGRARPAAMATSSSSRTPARPSPRTWAREPARSSAASRRSKAKALVNAMTLVGGLRTEAGPPRASRVAHPRRRALAGRPGLRRPGPRSGRSPRRRRGGRCPPRRRWPGRSRTAPTGLRRPTTAAAARGQAQPDLAGHVPLGGGDEGVERLLERREPQPVVDELGPARLEPRLLVGHVALEGEVLEVGCGP